MYGDGRAKEFYLSRFYFLFWLDLGQKSTKPLMGTIMDTIEGMIISNNTIKSIKKWSLRTIWKCFYLSFYLLCKSLISKKISKSLNHSCIWCFRIFFRIFYNSRTRSFRNRVSKEKYVYPSRMCMGESVHKKKMLPHQDSIFWY